MQHKTREITRNEPRQENWKNSNIQVFWGEIAPYDHLVQMYDNRTTFMNTLEGFACSGLASGDSVVIIATQSHLSELEERLSKQGFDLDMLCATDQYIPIEASEALSRFMVNNWPDATPFYDFISSVIERAKGTANRKIRAFGEMVALLWEQGHYGATVQLENLWHHLHSKNKFTLYCAYPKSGFRQDAGDSMLEICRAHTRVIDGQLRPSTEVYYCAPNTL